MSNVALDTNFLIALAEPGVELGAAAGELSGGEALQRLQQLWKQLADARDTIVIPAPALAEAMVKDTSRMTGLLDRLSRTARMKIEPFGPAAALEAAELFKREFPNRKAQRQVLTRSKLKFDIQIIAVARVANCSVIYSTDQGLRRIAERAFLPARGISDLALPVAKQPSLFEGGAASAQSANRAQNTDAPEDDSATDE